MASVKSIFSVTLALTIALGVVVGGVSGWQAWQTFQARKALTEARALLDAGKAVDADRLLAECMRTRTASAPCAGDVMTLRLTALRQAGDAVAEQALARRALDAKAPWVRAGEEGWARAQLAGGEAALDAAGKASASGDAVTAASQADAARKAFEAIVAQAGDAGWGRNEAQFALAKVKLANADEFQAGWKDLQALMERLPDDPASQALRPRVERTLGRVNLSLLMDRQPHGTDQVYVIQKGDSIDRIRRKFKIAPELLMHVNGIANPKLLSIGRRVKIPDMVLSIVVNKRDNALYVLNHGKFFTSYRVATGKSDDQTPLGDYTIGTKSEADGPWLGFLENPSVGIHAVTDPKIIGTTGSFQGVGLAQEDAEELYGLIPRGTTVKITGARPSMTFTETPANPLTAASGGAIANAPEEAPAAAETATAHPALPSSQDGAQPAKISKTGSTKAKRRARKASNE